MRIILAPSLALILLCGGCASVTQGTTHPVRIDTVTEQGEQVEGAACAVSNDRMDRTVPSGTTFEVRRSSVDLQVNCAAPGRDDASARLVSRANMGLAGNIILGGAIGAVVDHSSGAAYTYPGWVRLVFGQSHVFDRRDEQEGVAMTPPDVVVQAARPRATVDTPAAAVRRGDTFVYRVTDRSTGRQEKIFLRAERVAEGEVSFNNGSRIETADGRLVRLTSAAVGELDNVTPPGGWFQPGRMDPGLWKTSHRSIVPATPYAYDLNAFVEGERQVRIGNKSYRAVRIALSGWVENRGGMVLSKARYEGAVWLSPELRRVVRFEARAAGSGSLGSSYFTVNELVELVGIEND